MNDCYKFEAKFDKVHPDLNKTEKSEINYH